MDSDRLRKVLDFSGLCKSPKKSLSLYTDWRLIKIEHDTFGGLPYSTFGGLPFSTVVVCCERSWRGLVWIEDVTKKIYYMRNLFL